MTTMRKITISAPAELVDFVDQRAKIEQSNRSQIISQILSAFREAELERLAAEGYQFYAEEALDFAEASADAVNEVVNVNPVEEDWEHDRQAW